ncbi:restriction endonuclease subunit S [Vibrio lentus]|uniref:restriction endonuclease subunit S n=1 Tax=Vibrio lentus TaxID=136468 RepID=UPI000C837F87|nr:restriction endonuclease subunit S [Vibrio lentus]PMI85409.1 restriction endonuclease subunit S [Vibrio lentus]
MAFSKDINELVTEDTSGLLNQHKSWERVTLRDVVDVVNGYAFSSSGFNTGKGLPLIRIRDIISGETNTTFEGDFSDDYIVDNGDLLIGMDGDFNSAFWRSGKALLNQRVCKLTASDHFYSQKFLAYLVPGYLDAIHQNTSAVTVKHLSSKTIQSIPLPLPARKEQDRLVEKIDELFSEFDTGVEELKSAQVKLTQYRQSLLKSAVEGSLTQQWREANSGSIKETGAQLLERILTERRERWEEQKLADFKAKDKKPSKNWQEKYPEPVRPDTADLPKLPAGWVWASVAQLGHVQLGRQRTPSKMKGENPQKYIRAANITEQGINFEDVLEMDFTDKEIPIYQLQTGDLLLTEASGSPEHVGRPCVWPEADGVYCFQNTVIRFQPLVIASDFSFLIFYAYQKLGKYIDVSGGVGINHLSAGKFSKIAVPLPPLAEQSALVEEIAIEFDAIDRQVEATALGLKQSEAQRKNILKSAFSGQLVPQDPNDEPASVLLEKIKIEREALAKMPKPRAPRKSKKKVDVMDTLLEVLTAEDGWIDAQEAFKKCGIVDGTSTDRIEEIYTELRKLEKAGQVEIERNGDGYDQLKLMTKASKED